MSSRQQMMKRLSAPVMSTCWQSTMRVILGWTHWIVWGAVKTPRDIARGCWHEPLEGDRVRTVVLVPLGVLQCTTNYQQNSKSVESKSPTTHIGYLVVSVFPCGFLCCIFGIIPWQVTTVIMFAPFIRHNVNVDCYN